MSDSLRDLLPTAQKRAFPTFKTFLRERGNQGGVEATAETQPARTGSRSPFISTFPSSPPSSLSSLPSPPSLPSALAERFPTFARALQNKDGERFKGFGHSGYAESVSSVSERSSAVSSRSSSAFPTPQTSADTTPLKVEGEGEGEGGTDKEGQGQGQQQPSNQWSETDL